ncbi:MAG: acetyl-CoA carboxylase biotin carboxyl carrier protein subunit [Burkholderiaceae bacterium]|jgi:acetyl-CoA carboxylase biotin carboxyl carrier protein|nr:acetyl-CoA carboxylase biotin carboxyl carrier protein subunit [Burkholderiaceae bacterium]
MTFKVHAPMAGSILRVEVTQGAAVEPDTVLVTIESMKMEVPVEAMFAGAVQTIHCAAGDLVDQDQLLVTLA